QRRPGDGGAADTRGQLWPEAAFQHVDHAVAAPSVTSRQQQPLPPLAQGLANGCRLGLACEARNIRCKLLGSGSLMFMAMVYSHRNGVTGPNWADREREI